MLKVNDKEIENVFFNGTQLDHVYVNGIMVYESTIYIAKPTISGAYTFDTTEHEPKISGYNADAMEVSGVTKASSAGTYTVTFKLKKGYAWEDESRDDVSLTWNIAKRSIDVPVLSATWFAWVEGAQHGVIVSGIDATYVSQSGDTYQTDNGANIGAQHVVTWALKYPESTTWTDGSNSNKSQTWGVSWQNGTSHYANDLYNAGWNSGHIIDAYPNLHPIAFNSDHIAYYVTSSAWSAVLYENAGIMNSGKTLSVEIQAVSGSAKLTYGTPGSDGSHTVGSYDGVSTSGSTTLTFTSTKGSNYYILANSKGSGKITRIWAV